MSAFYTGGLGPDIRDHVMVVVVIPVVGCILRTSIGRSRHASVVEFFQFRLVSVRELMSVCSTESFH
jgi:hypothetical protein